MKLFRIALPLIVLMATIIGPLATSASAAAAALDFRVAPASGSQLSEGDDYFVLEMEPGEVRTQAVEISNPSSLPLRVQLAAVDAATAQMGGVDYGLEQSSTEAAGGWISLEQGTISLEPDASTKVRFEVEVPSDAVTGVHLGGLVVWVEGAEQETVAGAPATMSVQSRRVIAVQVELPGASDPVLEIRGAKAEARPDGLYLGLDLFNSGRGFAKGTGTVSIEGRNEIGTFDLDTVVPRTGTNFPFRWGGSTVPNGSYEVSVEIDYGAGIATWQGEVSVGPALQADLRGHGVGEGAGARFPRVVIALGIAVMIVVLLLIHFRKRALLSSRGSRPPRRSVAQPAQVPAPPLRVVTRRRPTARVSLPTEFVPRSEEEQRRVPPPPPPPPPARPVALAHGYAGAVGASNFDY